jgi:hypothetical protein
MNYPPEQVEELKAYCSKLLYFEEAGRPYFRMEGLRLPPGCTPSEVEALFCPVDRGDGYPSRLFFTEQIKGPYQRNWHVNVRLGERNWVAYSWKVAPKNRTLSEGLVELFISLTRPS